MKEEIANLDAASQGAGEYVVGLQQLLLSLKPHLSPGNYDAVVAAATEASAALLERALMQCRFNRVCA